MQEFLILIIILLFIAFAQKGAEILLDKHELGDHKSTLKIACLVTSYIFVGRYFYVHILEELLAFVGFTF